MKFFYKTLLGITLFTFLLVIHIRPADGAGPRTQERNLARDEFPILPIRIESHDPETGKFCSPYFILRYQDNGRNDILFRLPNVPATLLLGFAQTNTIVIIDESLKRPTAKRSPYRGNMLILNMNQDIYQKSKECLPYPRSFI